MTPEEYEIAYCKGRRQEMEDFVEWLDDHIMVAKSAKGDGVPAEKVLERTLEFMDRLARKMEEKLEKGPKLISRESAEK
jgi:hypothetical protein